MPVYVDNAFIAAAVPNGSRVVNGRWCHMTADSRSELDAMADRIGLSRRWIQHPGTWKEHYDLTESKRQAAILAGAVDVDWQEHTRTWARVRRLRMQGSERDSMPVSPRSLTTVVNVRTSDSDVYIGRGSDWGNPFRIGEDGTRAQVVRAFEMHLRARSDLLERLHELRGRRLGCSCVPDACHGDVLARYADMTAEELRQSVGRGDFVSATPRVQAARPRKHRAGLVPPASFVAIDFETCMARRASPIQIGVVRVIDGVVGRTNTSPVMPPAGFRVFERGAQRVHGLAPDYIDGAPEWPEVLRRLIRIATGEDGRLMPLVAHNAAFERSVISQTSVEVGIPDPAFTFFDTVAYARRELPDAPNHKLNTLVDYLGLGSFQHHDAGEDAAMTAHLLLRLAGSGAACEHR